MHAGAHPCAPLRRCAAPALSTAPTLAQPSLGGVVSKSPSRSPPLSGLSGTPPPPLLGRNRLESELPGVSHAYTGRRIVITGAGNAFCAGGDIGGMGGNKSSGDQPAGPPPTTATSASIGAGSAMSAGTATREKVRAPLDAASHTANPLPLGCVCVVAGLPNDPWVVESPDTQCAPGSTGAHPTHDERWDEPCG